MEHNMKLNKEPFQLMKSGKKTIEIRLKDEKRQKVKIGDIIIFTEIPEGEKKNTIKVQVIDLLEFKSFKEMYEKIPFTYFGCEGESEEYMLKSTYDIYSKEKEREYGVLGIKVKII